MPMNKKSRGHQYSIFLAKKLKKKKSWGSIEIGQKLCILLLLLKLLLGTRITLSLSSSHCNL